MANQKRRRRPATTPESRENQLISAAFDLAEQRILNGTASAQEITQFIRWGSERERLERERLRHESKLLEAKVENMASAKRQEELYAEALAAMRRYAGQDDEYEEDYYED